MESSDRGDELNCDEVMRYSRQLILPQIGMTGQLELKRSSVLIVGAGGLGCPAALYLAAAGVGTIGIVDHDTVDLTNLHRQILHRTSGIGVAKVDSAAAYLNELNGSVRIVPHRLLLDSGGSTLQLISGYQLVLDCTDNVATRYLLNDACVLTKRPLVSAAALRFDGQLSTYHYDGGPCYRCLFPRPPPAETVTNCSDGGVLGVVPGIIGSLQAMEAIRVLVSALSPAHSGSMLLYSALSGEFRSVRLRQRQIDCVVCGENATIRSLIDYTQFCGSAASDKDKGVSLLQDADRLSPLQFSALPDSHKLLVDVRQSHELQICAVDGALNVPLDQLYTEAGVSQILTSARQKLDSAGETVAQELPAASVTVAMLCRRGNDSQKAAVLLRKAAADNQWLLVTDIIGGLYSWKNELQPDMLLY